MPIGRLQTEGDLQRWTAEQERRNFKPPAKTLRLPELDDDPAAPTQGAVAYVLADNGAGKREARIIFPTGAPVVLATEP